MSEQARGNRNRRIYTWAGRVRVAEDYTSALEAFGIPGIKATLYDLTDGLAELADQVLGPVQMGGGRRAP